SRSGVEMIPPPGAAPSPTWSVARWPFPRHSIETHRSPLPAASAAPEPLIEVGHLKHRHRHRPQLYCQPEHDFGVILRKSSGAATEQKTLKQKCHSLQDKAS